MSTHKQLRDFEDCWLTDRYVLALFTETPSIIHWESAETILDANDSLFEDVKATAEKLGLQVLNCGIRDVILTGEMKEIMNQVLVAQKKAQANIITRREETASTRSLLNTAKLMEENEMLFKLKEMEYVEKIADRVGEITVNGNGNMVKQLKEIFAVNK